MANVRRKDEAMNPSELNWLRNWLRLAWKTAPHSSWNPDIYGDNIDADDLKTNLRYDALRHTEEIWEAISTWSESQKWPRLQRPAAYFLRERLLFGMDLAEILGEQKQRRPSATPMDKDRALSLLRDVFVDRWAAEGVSKWIEQALDTRKQCVNPHDD